MFKLDNVVRDLFHMAPKDSATFRVSCFGRAVTIRYKGSIIKLVARFTDRNTRFKMIKGIAYYKGSGSMLGLLDKTKMTMEKDWNTFTTAMPFFNPKIWAQLNKLGYQEILKAHTEDMSEFEIHKPSDLYNLREGLSVLRKLRGKTNIHLDEHLENVIWGIENPIHADVSGMEISVRFPKDLGCGRIKFPPRSVLSITTYLPSTISKSISISASVLKTCDKDGPEISSIRSNIIPHLGDRLSVSAKQKTYLLRHSESWNKNFKISDRTILHLIRGGHPFEISWNYGSSSDKDILEICPFIAGIELVDSLLAHYALQVFQDPDIFDMMDDDFKEDQLTVAAIVAELKKRKVELTPLQEPVMGDLSSLPPTSHFPNLNNCLDQTQDLSTPKTLSISALAIPLKDLKNGRAIYEACRKNSVTPYTPKTLSIPALAILNQLVIPAMEGSFRKDNKTPAAIHSARVADRVASLGGGVDAQVAAACHDLLEDTDISETELSKNIGKLALSYVNTLTRKKNETYAAYISKIRLSGSEECMLIKLCDILDNIKDAPSESLKLKYLKNGRDIYKAYRKTSVTPSTQLKKELTDVGILPLEKTTATKIKSVS